MSYSDKKENFNYFTNFLVFYGRKKEDFDMENITPMKTIDIIEYHKLAKTADNELTNNK